MVIPRAVSACGAFRVSPKRGLEEAMIRRGGTYDAGRIGAEIA